MGIDKCLAQQPGQNRQKVRGTVKNDTFLGQKNAFFYVFETFINKESKWFCEIMNFLLDNIVTIL